MKKLNIVSFLLVITLSAAAQIPVISVRFANPQYNCTNQEYVLDVEFKSSVAGKQLYGMNVRFFYDDLLLEYQAMENFASGYGTVSPSPALMKTDAVNGGAAKFGFPQDHPLEFINGAIQLTGSTSIILSATAWTRIFSIRFHVDDPNSLNIANFSPSVVWDLESNTTKGGWLNGDDGVVISVVAPSPRFSSPAAESAVQFNWQYNATAGILPYGMPAGMSPVSTIGLGPVGVTLATASTAVNAGDTVTFTATPVNGGASPYYQWMVNGVPVGTSSNTFTYVPNNNDAIACILTSSESCVTGNPAISNAIIMEVSGVSQIVNVNGVAISDGQTECYNATKILTIAGNNTTFTVLNGGHATMIAGEKILYKPGTVVEPGGYMHGYITTNNQYCGYQPPALPSSITGISGTQGTGSDEQERFVIYPNPTNGFFTVEQTGNNIYNNVVIEIAGMQGETLKSVTLNGEKSCEFRMPDLAQGLYFVKIMADGTVSNIKLVKMK
jgi:hypothetical protein